MELLRPSCPPSPRYSPEFLSGFSSPANFRRGYRRESISQSSRIVVEEDENDKIHVAVGNSAENALSLLNWTLQRFEGKEICLLHVYRPSQLIPTAMGKLPASRASEEVVSAYRKYEREQMLKLLKSYMAVCSKAKVNASIVTIESDKVEKGIVDLVSKHGIRKLVMGAVPENWVKKSSSKANYATKNAPLFCEIWFVSKRKQVMIREASEVTVSQPSCNNPQITKSRLFQYGRNKSIHPDLFQSKTAASGEVSTQVPSMAVFADLTSSPNLCRPTNRQVHELYGSNSTSSSSNASECISSERMLPFESDLKSDENIYEECVNTEMENEASRNQAHADLLKLRKLESETVEAINKVKMLELACAREVELRKEAEDALKATLEEQEKFLEEREQITQDLHLTMRNVALLESRMQEANHRHDEATGELKLVQESIATLRQEKQHIRRQKMDAVHWLERWRSRGEGGSANGNGVVRFVGELPELAEFSLSDLQTATCNFSESFKIGQGGYGCVYKGEMLGRTVAIRKIHSHNMQGELEFQQEVKVLGKLQHPHLVTLLGVCPEACSIVYEYLPNGTLQNHLSQKSNILTWKTRVRIIANIASALCFLHSSKPEKVVHGDLTPRKILLDSNLNCKIRDFGISRLISEDNIHCPSMPWGTGPKAVFPYTDPEFQRVGVLTPKSDAYSFGLIILQLLTRKSPAGLIGEVRRAISSGKLESILDSSAGEWPTFVVRRLVDIALQCCELNSRDRPDLTPSLVSELEQLHMAEERPVPSFFLCPIRQEIMHDPQVAADGFTYEGEAMRGWLQNGKETSPMTNLKLTHLHLTPNHAIRLAIQDWLCNS